MRHTWFVALMGLVLIGPCGCDAQPEADAPAPSPGATETPDGPADEAVQLPVQLLSDQELADGWIGLFDGVTLYGWHPTSDANWRVQDGTITVDSGEKGLLCTTSQYADYVLKLEFECDATTNSGVFLRTLHDPGNVETDCYELNIAPPDNPFPTGGLVAREKAPAGLNRSGWQSYEVTVEGDRVRVVLDGEQVLDYRDADPIGRGFIGLQLNEGRVAFRNIKLKPLGLSSLFNGRDLTGWTTDADSASEFSVDEEEILHVRSGPGQLESEARFADFICQLECQVNAPGLNSGVFFRCIPGDRMMGYESQIHNGFQDGDRTKPVDCGTGGIFRRQTARFVVADDLNWFYKTILADGPHMAVWVNGIQVSDWTDTRPADPNPRRGLRLEAGTLIIQGHDPTTDLSFRHFRAGELPPR